MEKVKPKVGRRTINLKKEGEKKINGKNLKENNLKPKGLWSVTKFGMRHTT